MLGFRSHFLKRPDQDIFWSKISGHIVPKKEHIFHKINIILKQYFWNFFVRHFFYIILVYKCSVESGSGLF